MKTLMFFAFLFISTSLLSAQKGDYHFRLGMLNNRPVMHLVTVKTFGCSTYGIYLRQGWSRDTLTVNIIGIDSRPACNNVPDKAREVIELKGIREKEFILRFLHEKKMNFFRVEFDGEDFTVTPELSDFVHAVTN